MKFKNIIYNILKKIIYSIILYMEKKGTYHESQKRACKTYYEKNKEELLKKQMAREKERLKNDEEYYQFKLAKIGNIIEKEKKNKKKKKKKDIII